MPSCCKCGQEYKKNPSQSWKVCPVCNAQYMRDYREKNSAKLKAFEAERLKRRRLNPEWVAKEQKRGRDYWARLKNECFMAYGGYKCTCCGESEKLFLTLDHVNNDGSEHRKEIGSRGSGIFKWLKDRGYPKGFQILCMNCNHGKALNNGICPHNTASRKQGENGEQPDRPIPCQAPEMEKV